MNIAFFEINEIEMPQLKERFKKHNLHFFKEPLSVANVREIADFDIISVFIYSKVNRDIIEKVPKLRLISTRSMGFDHIDVAFATKRNIKVCTATNYGNSSVAEHAFALLLSISRNIHRAFIRTVVEDYSTDGLQGFDLQGKTLGVIGTGRIGMNLIRMAKGFEMKVIANDVFKNNKAAKELKFKYVPLSTLLRKSDIISIHIPYTPKNHHLINSKTIPHMKKGVVIINTARGPLIDTKALIEGLESGKIAGAGLDVLEGEEMIKEEKEILHRLNKFDLKKMRRLLLDHRLLHDERVVFTPHIAFYTKEAVQRILDITMDNIEQGMKGKPINTVN